MTNKTKEQIEVFFGIMVGDLFLGEEHLPEGVEIDYDASVTKYAKMCEAAIVAEYARHNQVAIVSWDSQDVGGATPSGLMTRVHAVNFVLPNDYHEIEFVDGIISEVWEAWKWCVTNETP